MGLFSTETSQYDADSTSLAKGIDEIVRQYKLDIIKSLPTDGVLVFTLVGKSRQIDRHNCEK